jgi:hypothetical protein
MINQRKSRDSIFLFGVLILLLGIVISSARAGPIGTKIGPYEVTRILPANYYGGNITFADGSLYLLEGAFGYIHRLDPLTGSVLADYYVPGSSLHDDQPYDLPTGLARDENYFYMASRMPNYLRKLNLGTPPDVTVLSQTSLPYWPMDLTYANGYLYYPEYTGPIRKVDPSTGNVVGTLPSPDNYIYGMTFDGQNLIAANGVGVGDDKTFWVISPQDGSIQDTWTWTVPGWNNTKNIYGLAFDQVSRTLYISYSSGIAVAVPEPATLLLLGFGSLALLRKRRK